MRAIVYKHILAIFSIFSFTFLSAQKWVDMIYEGNHNFYDIQAEFYKEWEGKEYERGKGYKQFKRWEYFMEPRVYPHGNIQKTATARAWNKLKNQKEQSSRSASWEPLGPDSWTSTAWNPGLGRINAIKEDPQDPSTLYIGSPSGGLWKSTDAGSSWEVLTDNLPTLGVSGIAIHPANSDIIYIGTGDGNAFDTYSMGVMKSEDGGQTWISTGLSWNTTQPNAIRELTMHPNDPDIIFAVSSTGLFKTEDGANSWTQIMPGGFRDFMFHPTDPSIAYLSSDQFYRSVDGGNTFTEVIDGTPTNATRIEIAVSPDEPDYVYFVAANQDNGLEGVYRSTDSGESFSLQMNSPNILGWASDGSAEGGQAWYDLAVAVSPNNANELFVGGINLWKSTDGGQSFNLNAFWVWDGSSPYVHADIHELIYFDDRLYCGSDGGIFQSTNAGGNWTDLSFGLEITQFYAFDVSPQNSNIVLGGTQDNGTNLYNGNGWTHVIGADGMQSRIDYTNNDIMYGATQFGSIRKSMDGGANFSVITSDINDVESGGWVTPYQLHPTDPSILYAGYENLWRSDNGGDSWYQLSQFSGQAVIRELTVAPSDPEYIYYSSSFTLRRTTDNGSNWSTITSGLPNNMITSITVHPEDPEVLWITLSGFDQGEKIYVSTDGGDNWENISANLPNIPANCLAFQEGSDGGLYIGTDVGIFYTDSTLANWEPFMDDLPNVIVNQFNIHYGSNTIFAATYGRGIWNSNLHSPSTLAPQAEFTSDKKVVCVDEEVAFTDMSSHHTPGSWQWTFTGGTPATSTEQSPTVTYDTPGIYSATLEVSNGNGNDIEEKNMYIEVLNPVGEATPFQEGFESLSSLENSLLYVGEADLNELNWSLNENVGYASNQSAYLAAYQAQQGHEYELISKTFNLSTQSEAWLSFKYAFTEKPGFGENILRVQVSQNCEGNWPTAKTITGNELTTAESSTMEFIPQETTDWKMGVIELPASFLTNEFRFKLIFEGEHPNNLYIDNINISAEKPENTISVNEITTTSNFTIFPNPFRDELTISYEGDDYGTYDVQVFSATGQLVLSEQIQNTVHTINLSDFHNGIYLIKINTQKGSIIKKVVKSH